MFGDFRTAALLGAGLAFTSCDALEPTFCTTDFRWGLEVSVFDAETGASLADSATLHLRDGTWTETVDDPVWPGEPGVIHAAGERGIPDRADVEVVSEVLGAPTEHAHV